MAGTRTRDRLRDKTLRWTFTEGPQANKTYEHTFHADGTVVYAAVDDRPTSGPAPRPGRDAGPEGERPRYAAYEVSDDVVLVSYLAGSGFTLTVALNFADHQLVSIASNSEQWFPARGTFTEADGPDHQ
jgi:hypothetical protein